MQPDMSGAVPAPGTEGFLTHIRQLGASMLGHAAMRVELLSIEVQEEKARLARLAKAPHSSARCSLSASSCWQY